jgi:hypothetical protein
MDGPHARAQSRRSVQQPPVLTPGERHEAFERIRFDQAYANRRIFRIEALEIPGALTALVIAD